ncbi:MAG: hypothetical protein IAG13_24660 [Deltaproteobacteria bacterium]|nr:hypothetical protein [Nannocystaceae bacterium]
MSTSHALSFFAVDDASGELAEVRIVAGRLLGDETPVETELTTEGDDFEFVGEELQAVTVPPPPRVRSRESHAPIMPPPRRPIATS